MLNPDVVPKCLNPRDPGNWATGLAGGAKFGYALLFVILVSNIMAMFLQHLALKLGVASGRDLAQACRDAYPRCVLCVSLLWGRDGGVYSDAVVVGHARAVVAGC